MVNCSSKKKADCAAAQECSWDTRCKALAKILQKTTPNAKTASVKAKGPASVKAKPTDKNPAVKAKSPKSTESKSNKTKSSSKETKKIIIYVW